MALAKQQARLSIRQFLITIGLLRAGEFQLRSYVVGGVDLTVFPEAPFAWEYVARLWK